MAGMLRVMQSSDLTNGYSISATPFFSGRHDRVISDDGGSNKVEATSFIREVMEGRSRMCVPVIANHEREAGCDNSTFPYDECFCVYVRCTYGTIASRETESSLSLI